MLLETTTFRVLDTLARTIGEPLSIRALAREIEDQHGTGHYANVHGALQELAKAGIISFSTSGRSKIPRLRFDRAGFADTMATLELSRKRQLLSSRPVAAEPLHQLEARLAEHEEVLSVCLADAERNLKLRRLEPLVLLHDPSGSDPATRTRAVELRLTRELARVGADVSLRIDPWVLPAGRFGGLLGAREANPAPWMLCKETCLWHPQGFWRAIAEHLPRGEGIAPETPDRLSTFEEDQIAWDMNRWGYEERGRDLDMLATPSCPEVVALAALSTQIPRWLGGAAVVLWKADLEPTVLAYLAKAEDLMDELATILEILHQRRPDPGFEHALHLLQAQGAEPASIDGDMVTDALELYGG